MLKSLIIQGLIKLLEENVSIICKQSDEKVISSVLDEAKATFLNKLKAECTKKYQNFNTKITIDQKNRLPETM